LNNISKRKKEKKKADGLAMQPKKPKAEAA
jgi:hypothetical protein